MNANHTSWFLCIIEWDWLFLFILNFVLEKWLRGWVKHKNLFQNRRSSSIIFQCFPSSLYMKRSLKAYYIIETRQIRTNKNTKRQCFESVKKVSTCWRFIHGTKKKKYLREREREWKYFIQVSIVA